jgi:hypothetical protein
LRAHPANDIEHKMDTDRQKYSGRAIQAGGMRPLASFFGNNPENEALHLARIPTISDKRPGEGACKANHERKI